MKITAEELAELCCCPRTHEPLRLDGDQFASSSGRHRYPLVHGIPFLVTRQRETPQLLDEFFRYRRFFQLLRSGAYEADRLGDKLEEIKQSVRLLRRYFDSVVGAIDFGSQPLVLDVAAGMMETSRELSRRGARVVATDFSFEELLNPRIYSFFDERGYDWSRFSIVDGQRALHEREIDFARVLAPAERLPFRDEAFDVVFTRSALHHVKDLEESLAEMSRVLRVGGLLVVAGECIRPPWDSELDYRDGEIDFQEGIDEQMRTWGEYHAALRRAGFGDLQVTPLLASSGKHLPRMLAALRLRDPFGRLDGRQLRGISLMALQAMGCVVGWVARRTGDPPDPPAPAPEGKLPLAQQMARFEEFDEELRSEALEAHRGLPRYYTARTMPRPECYGFGELFQHRGRSVRRMYRSGCLVTGGRYLPRRAPLLRLINDSGRPVTFEIETFPEGGRKIWTLKPGRNRARLDFPVRLDAPAVEFHFRIDGDGPVYFREIRRE